jgi:3-mercaptopyruvate sulfurtransferase SseA
MKVEVQTRMKTKNTGAVVAALLALSVAESGRAQARADKPGAVGATAAPMPKTDRMPMAEFKKLLAANDVVVVDVRSGDAYVGGHIPGALSIPEETLSPATAEKLKRMGKPVALYCS